ncbi:MAG: hypothetical protein LUF87_03345 [Alistipes sp.]|nr:hypothetical protein [Alistipes sp.]
MTKGREEIASLAFAMTGKCCSDEKKKITFLNEIRNLLSRQSRELSAIFAGAGLKSQEGDHPNYHVVREAPGSDA